MSYIYIYIQGSYFGLPLSRYIGDDVYIYIVIFFAQTHAITCNRKARKCRCRLTTITITIKKYDQPWELKLKTFEVCMSVWRQGLVVSTCPQSTLVESLNRFIFLPSFVYVLSEHNMYNVYRVYHQNCTVSKSTRLNFRVVGSSSRSAWHLVCEWSYYGFIIMSILFIFVPFICLTFFDQYRLVLTVIHLPICR